MRVSTICRVLCVTVVIAAFCVPAAAQQEPTHYSGVCVKAKPGKADDLASQISGNVVKFEQSLVDLGKVEEWLALRAVIPAGKKAGCDYMLLWFYKGLPPEPMSDAEFADALQKSGLDMTPGQFWQPITDDSYMVYRDVGEMPTMIGSGKKGDYEVVNNMNMPDTGKCLATEEKLWQPLAEARIKEGEQSAWGTWVVTYPRGTELKGTAGTVDIYPSWDGIFTQGLMKTWEEVHPDVKFDDAMEAFNAECPIGLSEVYKAVEDIRAPMK